MKVQSPESTAQRIATAPEHYRSMINDDDNGSRFAVVRGARTVREVEAYLPSNYALMESFIGSRDTALAAGTELVVIIGGYDNAGWTLDGYVIPRLLSGLIGCEEIPA